METVGVVWVVRVSVSRFVIVATVVSKVSVDTIVGIETVASVDLV